MKIMGLTPKGAWENSYAIVMDYCEAFEVDFDYQTHYPILIDVITHT